MTQCLEHRGRNVMMLKKFKDRKPRTKQVERQVLGTMTEYLSV